MARILNCFLPLLVIAFVSSMAQQTSKLPNDRSDLTPVLRPFYHGVASGDPLGNKVIIWTRVTPDSATSGNIQVEWEMAMDTAFSQVVNNGTFTTDQSRDYTVKVDVGGLQPDTYYYYRFKAMNRFSQTGRTKTAPKNNVDSLRFAVASCANYADGYFNAYQEMVKRNDIDAVVHLGDYIYEYGNSSSADSLGRPVEPEDEILKLADYRMRYSHYRLDHDLRAAHQQYPWITVWDDHESANNSWVGGAENHDQSEGSWSNRKSAAKQAYFEWLPVREKPSDPGRVYRTINYGNLVDLIMLDTRLEGRMKQVDADSSALDDSTRTILGKPQYDWLIDELDSSDAQWKVMGQQVMMAPLEAPLTGDPINTDQWDGYPAERERLLDTIMAENINNAVVLTGDIHTSWANDLPLEGQYDDDANTGSVGVEFVTTSITSDAFPFDVPTAVIQQSNPHVQYTKLDQRGYMILDVTKQRAQADWYYMSTVEDSNYQQSFGTSWMVQDSNRYLEKVGTPSMGDDSQPQAPLYPDNPVSIDGDKPKQLVMTGAYPNPFQEKLIIQYFSREPQKISYQLFNLQGKLIHETKTFIRSKGLYSQQFALGDIPAGPYVLSVKTDNETYTKKVVKAAD